MALRFELNLYFCSRKELSWPEGAARRRCVLKAAALLLPRRFFERRLAGGFS